jgi:uncharacterized peroxidase-related enzyme
MSYLSPPAATGDTAAMYQRDRERVGYVPNYTKAFAGRTDVYAGWVALNTAIKANMPARTYELATLAAAARLRSSYCALAHGKILAEKHLSPQTVVDLIVEPAEADVSDIDRAVMTLAERVASGAAAVTDSDLEPLRVLGATDADIFDVILAASARCFFSSVLEASGAEPDSEYGQLEPALRDALTVGRAIRPAA